MNDPAVYSFSDAVRRAQNPSEPQPRAVGSPLPVGAGGRMPQTPAENDAPRLRSAPPLGRSLVNPSADSGQQASNLDRAMSTLRMVLPLFHRLLPLLDGNIGTAVSNLFTPHPQATQPQQAHPPLDLEPIESSLTDLTTQHRDLRNMVVEQNSSLKRVEDQLEMVREATDRNTLEQQELLEDLKTVSNKVNAYALFALGLLAVSILLNVILYLHIQRVLP